MIPIAPDGTLLLLSGGMDSTALAALIRPAHCLFIDYGQRPAGAEFRAARKIADLLNLTLESATLGIRDFGSGLLHDETNVASSGAPSPEWWPFRNQFLSTAAAAIALRHGLRHVAIGTVKGDGERHRDGTKQFYDCLDGLVRLQEGGVRISAPAIEMETEALIRASGLSLDVLGWTTSCHRSDLPCGNCPGCWKQQRVLRGMGFCEY